MILFVCEGNVCRSALAACLIATAIAPQHPHLRVESAGTLAAKGQRMDPATAAIALRNGVDPSAHRSRRVTAEILAEARLVLTATRAVRSTVVQMHPPSVQHTFTIRQVGRILNSATDSLAPVSSDVLSPLEELRLFITRNRGMPPADPTLDDVVDPRGQPASVHEWAAQQMHPGLLGVARALGVLPTWPDWVGDYPQPRTG